MIWKEEILTEKMELRKYQKEFIEQIKEAKVKYFVQLLASKFETCGSPITWYCNDSHVIIIFVDNLTTIDRINDCEIRFCKNGQIYTRITIPLQLSKEIFKIVKLINI